MASPLTSLSLEAHEGSRDYGEFLRPSLAETLNRLALDISYHRGAGDRLFYMDSGGREVEVLDLVGGYGASLFGHNHPALVARAKELLDAGRPFVAQGSVRSLAGRLAGRLSERVGQSTGRAYRVTLASTGTEAVEAAIKHAELSMLRRLDVIVEDTGRVVHELRGRLREGSARVPPGALEAAARLLERTAFQSADELFAEAARWNRLALEREPVFLALERGFHGKSTGALKLTFNERYREGFRRCGLSTRFLDPRDERSLDAAIESARLRYLHLGIGGDGALQVEERSLVNIAACFVEPIQGEGGVWEIPAPFLRALRAKADESGFPLVFDEIQCGMGRTGTFLASEPAGVLADYYLLSKSLGGGLSKISALLIEEGRYVKDFGVVHTSTFAEDDHASGVALTALELLEQDGLPGACAEKGAYLLGRLEALKQRYPEQIKDVRGRGLMIGMELCRQDRSPGAFLQAVSQQDMLGYFVASYLLHEERIRVAPTLSSPETLRLQPSAYVSRRDLDRVCEAIERLAGHLGRGDTWRLTRHLVARDGEPSASSVEAPESRAAAPISSVAAAPGAAGRRKIGFLGHFLKPEDLRVLDRGFGHLTTPQCADLIARVRGVLGPFLLDEATVRSPRGEAVDVAVFAIPFTSSQVMESFHGGGAGWAREQVESAVALAREAGCSVIGFGGYTSIVTNSCRDVVADDVVLTSGNSLTAAAVIDAILQSVASMDPAEVRLGLVGALGNIGSVVGEVLSEHIARIALIGRPGASSRLAWFRDRLYLAAFRRSLEDPAVGGLARVVGRSAIADRLRAQVRGADAQRMSDRDLAKALATGLREELGGEEPVQIAAEMAALGSCNVVVGATNAPNPVISSEHLARGPVVVCDVATPGDVAPSVSEERPDVVVLKGGIVHLPLGQHLRIRGMSLSDGHVYGCLAETLLHGLAGLEESLSVGQLTAHNVRRAHALALEHGFTFHRRLRE